MAETCNPQQLPYKMTPILPYDDSNDDFDDIGDDISVMSLGLDVFNKPLPGDDLNRIPRFPPPTKLPQLKIPGKKRHSRSPVKTPRSNDWKHIFQGPTSKLAWSGSVKKEKKRLKRLSKLAKFSEMKLPGIKTTRVTKIAL
ncbi:uncharacterized protein LOC121409524 [Lytechinus variegatus]|uniref:uncharacterized protein LOC121409524 n=1 Tax=Lytechinus variegatus TaxID=7654 RepID=UPI001BB13A08|nr:uncharacterized protein LOC121409524 [Lytechinus variegatus]